MAEGRVRGRATGDALPLAGTATAFMRRPPWKRVLLALALIFIGVMSYRVLGVYRSGHSNVRCWRRDVRADLSEAPDGDGFNIEGHASLLRRRSHRRGRGGDPQVHPDVVGINEAHRGTWQARFGDHVEQLRLLTGMNVVFGRSYLHRRRFRQRRADARRHRLQRRARAARHRRAAHRAGERHPRQRRRHRVLRHAHHRRGASSISEARRRAAQVHPSARPGQRRIPSS